MGVRKKKYIADRPSISPFLMIEFISQRRDFT